MFCRSSPGGRFRSVAMQYGFLLLPSTNTYNNVTNCLRAARRTWRNLNERKLSSCACEKTNPFTGQAANMSVKGAESHGLIMSLRLRNQATSAPALNQCMKYCLTENTSVTGAESQGKSQASKLRNKATSAPALNQCMKYPF